MVYYDNMKTKKIIFIGGIFIIASVIVISAIGNYSSAYAQGNIDLTYTFWKGSYTS